MAQNKAFSLGPVALTATLTTNIFNCAVTSLAGPVGFTLTQPFVIFKRIRITNKTAGAVTFTLYKGATGANTAGTELIGTAVTVPANDGKDFYGPWRFDAADFLVGGASALTSLTIEGFGEIGISG